MTLETILTILGFVLSFGGFVHALFIKTKQKEVLLISTFGALFVICVFLFIETNRNEQEIDRVQKEIIEDLSPQNEWNFEKIYGELFQVKRDLVEEALIQAVKENKITYQRKLIRNDDNVMIPIMFFRIRNNS